MAEDPETQDGQNFSLQGYGGMPKQLQNFEVKEHEVTNAPDSNDGWNENMGNPVGPK